MRRFTSETFHLPYNQHNKYRFNSFGELMAKRPFAFVLMPFEKSFDDIYQLGIKQTVEAAGMIAERVDEQLSQRENA